MLSRIACILCTALILYASFVSYPRWRQQGTEATISWDVAGYYLYLPAQFIYHDLKHQSFQQELLSKYHPSGNAREGYVDSATGHIVMKYSSGMALMYLPFFTVAHLLARPLGYPPDGFSPPYQLAVQLGGVLVALLGLWLLRRFLKFYYEDKVVALVLFLLVFGSNFLNWSAIDAALSHCWLYTIYTGLLLLTRSFYLRPSAGKATAIGLLVGLATLTRPTDIISCLIPLLWGLERINRAVIRDRLRFFRQQGARLLLAGVAAAMVISVQLIYWKYVTGRWIEYSYQDQGFSFLHPHLRDYTFDFTTGWLVYAPVMILAMLGIIPFWRHSTNKVMVLLFALLNYYIVASWDVWWYGSRAMIQSYPVLSILLAAFITAAFRKRWLLTVAVPCFMLVVYHNFWFTWFAHHNVRTKEGKDAGYSLYDASGMSREYFWRVVGRWRLPSPDVWKLKDTRHIFVGIPHKPRLLYRNDFEADTSFLSEPPIHGRHSLQADGAHHDTRRYTFPVSLPDGGWVRARATFRCTLKDWDIWSMGMWHITYIKDGELTHDEALKVHRALQDGETKTMTFEVKLKPGEADSLAIWLTAGKNGYPLLMDDLQVWSFKE